MHAHSDGHLALFCHKDCQLIEVVAGRLADDKGLHRRIPNTVHIQREGPHSCSHHAVPVIDPYSQPGSRHGRCDITGYEHGDAYQNQGLKPSCMAGSP